MISTTKKSESRALRRSVSALALAIAMVSTMIHVSEAFSQAQRPALLQHHLLCTAKIYRKSTPTTTALSAIVDEVTAEMKVAMKAKDTATLGTIRLIRGAFANAAIDLKTDKLTDEQAQTVLRKMAKMRQESIDMYEKGGAQDRAAAERAELALIERWLPKLADEDQTREWVKEAIDAMGGKDGANVGKVMGALMKSHKAEVDGNLAQKIVREELGK